MTARDRRDGRFTDPCRGAGSARAGAALYTLLWLHCCFGAVCLAQTSGQFRVPEQSIKAAYLYKFASYVEWPGEVLDGSITIGVLGAADFADELAGITAGRSVDNRPIRVVELQTDDAFDDLHILFVGQQEAGRLERLLSPARNRPILTVTETVGALSDGSIINFTVSDERVRFEVSLAAAEDSRLRLNSRLLAVAQSVQQAGP
jgi:hypothetical protein